MEHHRKSRRPANHAGLRYLFDFLMLRRKIRAIVCPS